jgi:hypothetical protein
MKKILAIALLGLALYACDTSCATGAVCGDNNFVGAGALPSPSPVPLPGASPDPCRIESVQVGFHSGAEVPFLALGAVEQLDATPYNSSGRVPDGCNQTRPVTWVVATPTTCQILGVAGPGYNPFIRGLKVGACLVTATVSNVTGQFSVEVR